MTFQNLNNILTLFLLIIATQSSAMKNETSFYSGSCTIAAQIERSTSPYTFKLYLPSHKMEPHRSISQEDIGQLKQSLEEDKLRVQLRNSNGVSPIEYAIERQSIAAVLLLLEHGASPAITCEETISNGFHYAAEHGTPEIVKLLMVHTIFPHIHQELKKALEVMDSIKSQDPLWRENYAHETADNLVAQHLKQLELLVTQANVQKQTPEQIASKNESIKSLFASNCLKDSYSDLLKARYVTEFMLSFSQINK